MSKISKFLVKNKIFISNNIFIHAFDTIQSFGINLLYKCRYDANVYMQLNNALLSRASKTCIHTQNILPIQNFLGVNFCAFDTKDLNHVLIHPI